MNSSHAPEPHAKSTTRGIESHRPEPPTAAPATANAPATTVSSTPAASRTPRKDAVISVRDLTRVYGEKRASLLGGKKKGKEPYTAVKGLSFEVHAGEVFGLLGTNGAGKTSTLEVVEGLAEASGGSIRVMDFDPIKDRAEMRKHTGIMLQSGGLPTQLTVRETMQMWAGTCSHPLPASEVLESVGLEHRLDVKVGSLSGGEQRRLDLACALVGDPSIIFLDEPTTGLDPESRRNVWTLLQGLKDRGVTMILTTHYLDEAERLCDRLAIMHEGEVALGGTLREIVSTVSSSITFLDPGRELPTLPGTQVVRSGARVEFSTRDLQADAFRVLQWAHSEGVVLKEFAARPASLETVFLEVAGVR